VVQRILAVIPPLGEVDIPQRVVGPVAYRFTRHDDLKVSGFLRLEVGSLAKRRSLRPDSPA
jgi:hypothetical protein